MLPFPSGKKASALRKLEMEMKQPLHFKYSSNDQDKPSPSTSGENTDACLLSIPDARGPENHMMFYFNETTD